MDLASARQSAYEDWKIDMERHGGIQIFDTDADRSQEAKDAKSSLFEENNESDTVEYERLSEFFFDLCLSWCHHLDIETLVYFLNGIFLNITTGPHVYASVFKDVDKVKVLSVEFFN